jgi:hypothetical protein
MAGRSASPVWRAALSGLPVAVGDAKRGGVFIPGDGARGPGASGPEEGKYLGPFLGIASNRVMIHHLKKKAPAGLFVPSDGAISLRIREMSQG